MKMIKDKELEALDDYHKRFDKLLRIVEKDLGHRRYSSAWGDGMHKYWKETMQGNPIHESAMSTPSHILHEEAMMAVDSIIRENNVHKRN